MFRGLNQITPLRTQKSTYQGINRRTRFQAHRTVSQLESELPDYFPERGIVRLPDKPIVSRYQALLKPGLLLVNARRIENRYLSESHCLIQNASVMALVSVRGWKIKFLRLLQSNKLFSFNFIFCYPSRNFCNRTEGEGIKFPFKVYESGFRFEIFLNQEM